MLNNHVQSGKEFDSQKLSISAALIAAAKPYRVVAEKTLMATLRSAKIAAPRYTVTASMKNSFDGEVAFQVSCVKDNWPVSFKVVAMVKDGKLVFADKDVTEPMELALKAAKEATPPAPAEAKRLEVDLTSVVAFRNGDIVSFTSPGLPQWALHVKAAEFMDEQSRKFVPSRVMASIRGFCITQFNQAASFKQEEFKLPMIQASVVAKPVAKMPPMWQVPVVAQDPKASGADNISVRASSPAPHQDPNNYHVQATNNRRLLESHLRSTAEPAVLAWVRKELKGGAPSIKSFDMSGVKYGATRKLEGSAVFNIKFYSNMGVEEASISVPFDAQGRADLKGIQRTQADLMADEERRAQLKIKSEEEAKRQFEEFVASERAKTERLKALGVKAGIGYGGSRPLPNFIIHVPKTSLPDEFSVVGKKIVVGGMIYEVEPTNYNSPDIEHCAFWALRLKPELGIKDADYVPNYEGVTAKLAAAGI